VAGKPGVRPVADGEQLDTCKLCLG
jgi:hypothetical protein